ncbi:beta-ketoacyl synthase N-terminal-like domain-containing protein [Halobaculum sp. MBLA0143]|uniref:thiolase C-terminal domain-containing protein n=1 Tax=Halobaculum sp. MBLA0143 TaxID=3079933 RepID=UPI0035241488
MTDAHVVGAGQSAFGSFPGETYRSLCRTAYERAVPADLDTDRIDEAYLGTLGVGGRQIGLSGPAVTEHLGLHGTPCTRVENACAASGYALRQAVVAVESGYADLVLAGGVEVMTDTSADATKYWLGVSGETEWERMAGTTFAGVYAQMADAYLREHDADRRALSAVAAKNHANGADNPKAHLGFDCSVDDAESADVVADPLTLYHCCPTSDGAAFVLVASDAVADSFTDSVRVAGVGAASDHVGLYDRETYTSVPATRRAAATAYDRAGVTDPRADLDFAEVHDCFAVAELLAYEDLGLADDGEGARLATAGVTARDGAFPVNTSGGLKSKGHPIGATGAGQAVEAFHQLTDAAGARQLSDPERGLTHNVGGSGGAAVVHAFERAGVRGA